MLTKAERRVRLCSRSQAKEADMAIDSNIQGPWAVGTNDAPRYPGVYIVFAKVWLEMPQVLYIGESGNIASRMSGHNRREDWEREARGRPLFFVAVPIELTTVRKRVEQELIDCFQPPCNRETQSISGSWDELVSIFESPVTSEPHQLSWDEIMSMYGPLLDNRTSDMFEQDEVSLNLAIDAYALRNHVSR